MESASSAYKKIILNFFLVFIFIILVLLLLKYNILCAPFHWDTMGFVIPAAEDIFHHGVFINKARSTGHPPLFLLTLSLTWKLFGKKLFVSHLLNIIIGSLGLTSLFFLTKKLYGIKVALLASTFLLFNQTFFSQLGLVYLSIPLVLTAVLSVFSYIQQKYWLYLCSAVSMLLIKETSIVVLGSILVYEFLIKLSKREKFKIIFKRMGMLTIPVVPLLIWWFIHYQTTGRIYRIDIFINRGNFLTNFFNNFVKSYIYDFSIEKYNRANWIIFILLILFFCTSIKRRKFTYEFLFILIILSNILIFTLTDNLPRYFLITMPFYLLMGARASVCLTTGLKGKNIILIALAVLYISVSVSNYYGKRNTDGWRLESNMEYFDMICLHKRACRFIETNYSSYYIITNYPLNIALRNPWYGYVKNPMRVTNFQGFDQHDHVLLLWSAQSNFGIMPRFIDQNRHRLRNIRNFSFRGKRVKILKKR